jgi:hypothetical protein
MQCLAYGLGYGLRLVAARRATNDLDAKASQLARHVGGVRIDRESEQQLITDRDQF